jgi:signal transduction histidine kinase
MKANPITIISQLELMQQVNITKLCQALSYADSLTLQEAMHAATEQANVQLQTKITQLEQDYAHKLATLLEQNQQQLMRWQEKQEQMQTKLQHDIQHLVEKIGTMLDFEQAKANLLMKQIMDALGCQSIVDEQTAQQLNLEIKLSFNNYTALNQQLLQLTDANAAKAGTWLTKFLRISHELADGTAIWEDNYSYALLSYSQIETQIKQLISNVFLGTDHDQ